jgi:hypothetical protein
MLFRVVERVHIDVGLKLATAVRRPATVTESEDKIDQSVARFGRMTIDDADSG